MIHIVFSIYKNEIVSLRKSGLPDLCLSVTCVLSAQLTHRRVFVVLQAVLLVVARFLDLLL